MISKKQAKIRIERLKKVINHHRYLYHVLDKQEISDAALDSLKHELKLLEEQFPDLLTSNSPTQRVSGKPLDKFKKIRHKLRMMSLEDVFSFDEIKQWHERIQKLVPREKLSFFIEPKFDGLALSMIYENGVLKHAATRGDGSVGEDVTNNVRTIESIPLNLELHTSLPDKLKKIVAPFINEGLIEIRGEMIISKKNFEKVNRERKKAGEAEYANPRNLAAGSVRQLDPKVTASRNMDLYAYDFILNKKYKLHSEEHKVLRALGFKTSEKLEKAVNSLTKLESHYKYITNIRDKLDFHIDGLVVLVDSNDVYARLGHVGKAPRGAVAYKFAAEESTTIVEKIVVQVGRTGALTPVAHLKPVVVGGVTISRATLHNEDEIKRLGLKVGDSVIVGRAGDVIPDVKKVLEDLRTGKEKSFVMPKHCPMCDKPVHKKEGEVITRCTNIKCPARHREGLYHFVSRKAFNIDGLGPKILNAFLDNGLIQDAADIFDLKEGDIVPLERFGEKSAENIIESVNNSHNISLERFIFALGILHVGEETAIDLAQNFGSIKALGKASQQELENIPDVGPKVAESIYNWFRDKNNREFLKKLKNAGIKIKAPRIVKSQKLENQMFVFTGEMSKMTRDEAKAKVRSLGGRPSESVSSKTDYVVAGESPGSKFQDAKRLGVKIIDEKQFLAIIKKA
ncbi:NAD-dependent DNA ligase LigA [Patescibacteria group bacterium]